MENRNNQPNKGYGIIVFLFSDLFWELIGDGWMVTRHLRFTPSVNRFTIYLAKEDAD